VLGIWVIVLFAIVALIVVRRRRLRFIFMLNLGGSMMETGLDIDKTAYGLII